MGRGRDADVPAPLVVDRLPTKASISALTPPSHLDYL